MNMNSLLSVALQMTEGVIPSKSNRANKFYHDQHVYKERHLVECCIGKLKQFRRVFSRFEKRACRYLSFLKIASTILWLR
ncbi:hypothetical protein [Piscirickettsia salmonis]|uniref:hypothetical protein n=1 Tax=Piscirickettsia salmonis TaxID=1238 RepID=UPI003A80830C